MQDINQSINQSNRRKTPGTIQDINQTIIQSNKQCFHYVLNNDQIHTKVFL